MTDQPLDKTMSSVVVDEPECEPVADPAVDELPAEVDGPALQRRLDSVLDADEDAEFDAEDGETIPTRGPRRFVMPGGAFAGSEAPILRAIKIAQRHGLTVTSTKREFGSATSDHHVSQSRSFAADLSNGSAPTPEMDAVCARLAKLLGQPNFREGVLNAQAGSLRFQLLYRTNVGGNHFNHIHVGCRSL